MAGNTYSKMSELSRAKLYQELFKVVKQTAVKKTSDDCQKKANRIWNELKKNSKNNKELANLVYDKINILNQEVNENKITFFNKLVQVKLFIYILNLWF